jgi:hypothetical protein
MTTADATIEAARSAWARIEGASTFEDWVAVARALAIGRAHAMAVAKVNTPFGRRFVAAIGTWLRQHGLDQIPGQERHMALKVLDQLDAIERWRAGLDPAVRRRLNHPNAVWWRWRRSTGQKPGIAKGAHVHPLPLGITQDAVARASDALYAMIRVGNLDCHALARAALLAATLSPRIRPSRQRQREAEMRAAV